MNSKLDKLEEAVMADMRGAYAETVLDHAMNPRNVGTIPDADGFAHITGPCGDTTEIWLRVKDGRIREATFWTGGCDTTIAAGSMVTELAKGKSIAQALRITQQDVLNALVGLPEGSAHCTILAANTLREAIKDYLAFKNESWKRAYGKRQRLRGGHGTKTCAPFQ